MIFSQNVAKIQRQHGYSITELSRAIGVSTRTANRILNNRSGSNAAYTPAYRTVRKVAESVGLTTDEVFKYHIHFETI